MARITDKRLYLSEFERPKWWKPNEWVQIIIDKDDMFSIWHKPVGKEGFIQIDNYFSIEIETISRDWTVAKHSADCIRLIKENIKNLAKQINQSKERIERLDFPLSIDLRNVKDMTKGHYVFAFKESLAFLLMGKISVSVFKAADKAFELIIREWHLFEDDDGKRELETLKQLRETILKRASDPNAKIIDMARTLKWLEEDGGKEKERKLDDIIIDTEAKEENLEEIEIDIED